MGCRVDSHLLKNASEVRGVVQLAERERTRFGSTPLSLGFGV